MPEIIEIMVLPRWYTLKSTYINVDSIFLFTIYPAKSFQRQDTMGINSNRSRRRIGGFHRLREHSRCISVVVEAIKFAQLVLFQAIEVSPVMNKIVSFNPTLECNENCYRHLP